MLTDVIKTLLELFCL